MCIVIRDFFVIYKDLKIFIVTRIKGATMYYKITSCSLKKFQFFNFGVGITENIQNANIFHFEIDQK